jgi:NitT/TauT family transport system ATP-binding protein
MVGLENFADSYPRELSGGMKMRVSIARALITRPKLLLMDEPFAALDAIVRTRITQELLAWVEQEHMTVLLVTHDLEEAISVSDVVYMLSQGPRAGIRARHEIPIPRPRNVLETRRDPRFAPLLTTLWNELSAASASDKATP